MGRPIERIEPILDIIREAWKKNPDFRITQLITNAGVGFYTEDLGEFVQNMSKTYNTTRLLWGTYGKDGKSKLEYLPIEKLSTSHIENILRTQDLSYETRETIAEEYAKRLNNSFKVK